MKKNKIKKTFKKKEGYNAWTCAVIKKITNGS